MFGFSRPQWIAFLVMIGVVQGIVGISSRTCTATAAAFSTRAIRRRRPRRAPARRSARSSTSSRGHARSAPVRFPAAVGRFATADEETIDLIESKKDTLFVGPCIGVLFADAYDRFPTREQAEALGAFQMMAGQMRVIPELRKRGVRCLPGGDYGFPITRTNRDLSPQVIDALSQCHLRPLHNLPGPQSANLESQLS